jgi:hypothetical protein
MKIVIEIDSETKKWTLSEDGVVRDNPQFAVLCNQGMTFPRVAIIDKESHLKREIEF